MLWREVHNFSAVTSVVEALSTFQGSIVAIVTYYLLDIQQTSASFNISLDRDHKHEKLRRKLFGIGKYHFDKFGGKPRRMFLVDCQTDQNFSHFLWHLNHKSFIEELLLTNDQSCDTWPLLDFVPLVILVAICFEVFQASNAMKWRSNFAFFQNYKSHFLQQFNKYFRVRQGKIHFQYHIVGPERKYWKWISIHFLPPINHIWPPGANISCSPKKMISFIKYQTNSLGDQFFNCET